MRLEAEGWRPEATDEDEELSQRRQGAKKRRNGRAKGTAHHMESLQLWTAEGLRHIPARRDACCFGQES
jgi:hypothetical protein